MPEITSVCSHKRSRSCKRTCFSADFYWLLVDIIGAKGGATIVIGGGTMSLPILMSAGDRGYKIIRWSNSLHALNELKCGKSNNKKWKSSKNAYSMFAYYDNRKATAYFLSTLYIHLSFINCHNVARVAVSSQSRWLFQWYVRLNHYCHFAWLPSPIHQTSATPTLGQSVENLVTTTFYDKLTPMTGSPVKCIDFNGYRHLYD